MESVVTTMILAVIGIVLIIPIAVTLTNIYAYERNIETINKEVLETKQAGEVLISPDDSVIYNSCTLTFSMPTETEHMGLYAYDSSTGKSYSASDFELDPSNPLSFDFSTVDLCDLTKDSEMELYVLNNKHLIKHKTIEFRNSGSDLLLCVYFNATAYDGTSEYQTTGPIEADVIISNANDFVQKQVTGCANFSLTSGSKYNISIIKDGFYAYSEEFTFTSSPKNIYLYRKE